ncbi:general substrate transporter [Pseudovirgaria hyperparasitica]|uniref:General substrate transporter n=1 Tax=Pseudovirgaria hyperparasitica TaxID=470096 RepID=A0A6A6WA40_9PEZI|nr:general substrate transporter [Pseudovirgaria hyperparasitica]KAF2759722.1 general substrate transporter [Pseudovirgaria hyperparasitica]
MPGGVAAALEPLIPGDQYSPDLPEDDDDVEERYESKIKAAGSFIWGLTLAAGVSGLLFGYDTGVISSTLVSIGSDLSNRPLTTLDKSLITSCTSLFALLASPITGLLADALGRKRVILVADILFIIGALWQALTTSVWGMIGGRSVVGLAVGSASFVVPLYISELAPSPFRGRLVTISSLFITGGQVVAYLIGWLFSTQTHGWKWMVGLGALPAAVQFCILGFMPETPRWLVKAGRRERAKRILTSVYGIDQDALVESVLRRIEKEVMEEETAAGPKEDGSAWSRITANACELFFIPANRRALSIACMLQGFQQLCGFNSLMYFSATIFSLVGFRSPTLTSLSIALTNFAFTIVAFYAIDRIGRRRILLYSIPIMTFGLVLCSIAFNFFQLPTASPQDALLLRAFHLPGRREGNKATAWPLVILFAMITYVAGYAIGLGNVPWQQSELFPLSVRALGSALATSTNWGSNTLVGLTFLPMMTWLTPVGTFTIYMLVSLASLKVEPGPKLTRIAIRNQHSASRIGLHLGRASTTRPSYLNDEGL